MEKEEVGVMGRKVHGEESAGLEGKSTMLKDEFKDEFDAEA